jgi:hypothetical protein
MYRKRGFIKLYDDKPTGCSPQKEIFSSYYIKTTPTAQSMHTGMVPSFIPGGD